MQGITLIQSANEAVANISLFNSVLDHDENSSRLVRLLPQAQSWYAFEDGERYRFGPSKFIGYAGMSAALYAEESGASGRLDGRVTEKKLQSWSTPILQGDPRYDKLHGALAHFCASYGAFPNKRARIALIEMAEKSPVTEMEQVKALSVLISALSDEAKRELKRLAFP